MNKAAKILAGISVLITLGLVIAIIVTGFLGPIPGGLVAAFFIACLANIGFYVFLVFTKNRK